MGLDKQAGSRDRFTLGWVRTVSIRPGEPAVGIVLGGRGVCRWGCANKLGVEIALAGRRSR
jgi:hypothetical protein